MSSSPIPVISPVAPDTPENRLLNTVLGGKMNATATLTLNANASTTTLTDSRIGFYSFIALMPTTASASTAFGAGYYVTCSKGSAVITHNNTADVDKTFTVLILC